MHYSFERACIKPTASIFMWYNDRGSVQCQKYRCKACCAVVQHVAATLLFLLLLLMLLAQTFPSTRHATTTQSVWSTARAASCCR